MARHQHHNNRIREDGISTYSDLNAHNPGRGNTAVVVDERSVSQAISMLIRTSRGERVFNPEYGCDVRKFLFQSMNIDTEFKILFEIIDAVRRWEPRVTLLTELSKVVGNPTAHEYKLTLVYEIKGLSIGAITQTETLRR